MKKIIAFAVLTASFFNLFADSEHTGCDHTLNQNLPFRFDVVNSREDGSIFREITEESGINYNGVSFGHAWADIDRDGFPDVFCSGHGWPTLYMNNQNGTFRNVEIDYYKQYDTLPDGTVYPYRFFDMHGVSFCDINNDGWPDLYVQLGGDMGNSQGKENMLFLNDNGHLIVSNRSGEFGLKDSLGRGRSTIWFDIDGDDYLEALLTNFNRHEGNFLTSLYKYDPGSEKYTNITDLGLLRHDFHSATLIRDHKNQRNNILTVASIGNGINIYETDNYPFKNIFRDAHWGTRDVAVGDFNGDGMQDIFIAANQYSSEAALYDDTTLLIYLYAQSRAIHYNQENRVSFKTKGPIKVESAIYPYKGDVKKYWRIGSRGYHPTENTFVLDPELNNNKYINKGCLLCLGPFIGYHPELDIWEIYQNDPIDNIQSAIKITSDAPITDIRTHNFNNNSVKTPDKMLIAQSNGRYQEDSKFLLNDINQTSAVSVVAADFDNDMDLDLVLSCQGSAINYSNKYYENDGSGKFTVIEGFGAEGQILGRGGSVSYADINGDGFLDLFFENGEGQLSDDGQPLHFNDGPYQLFLNKGNDNNWIKINLTDAASTGNKMAIGAVIHCYAGGKKQMRLKGSENHAFTQNDPVIHFGLAQNAVVDSLEIIWPNGDVSVLYDLSANRTYDISSKIIAVPTSEKDLKNNQLHIYPNPTNGQLRVEFDGVRSVKGIEIYSLNGQMVQQQLLNKFTNYIALNQLQLKENGNYILKIDFEDGSFASTKFMFVK